MDREGRQDPRGLDLDAGRPFVIRSAVGRAMPLKARRTEVFFFLADGSVRRFAQPLYASLARGEVAMTEFASKCLRVADWYVLYDGETAISIDNETYLILWFDEAGHARPHSDMSCAPPSGSPWTPTPAQRQRLSSIIFGRRDPAPH